MLRCLHSVSKGYVPQTPEYVNGLARFWGILAQCFKVTTGEMKFAVGCFALCVANELTMEGKLAESNVENLLYILAEPYLESQDNPMVKLLNRLVEHCHERDRPQLSQRLGQQIELMSTGVFSDQSHVNVLGVPSSAVNEQTAVASSLLASPALEDALQDCVFTASSADEFLNLVSRVLQCLSTVHHPDMPEGKSVLQRLYVTLSECFMASVGEMRCAVGCCLLCMANELCLSDEDVQTVLIALAQLHAQSPELKVVTILGRLVGVCRERQLPQLVERLQEQIQLISSGVLTHI